MKKSVLGLIILSLLIAGRLYAQDTIHVKVLGKNIVTVVDSKDNNSDVRVGENSIRVKGGKEDTVKIRVGRRAVIISDGRHNSGIRFEHLNDRELEDWTGRPAKFQGHWAGFEMGVNSFTNVNYKGFTPNFMDLNHNKSFEVGINFLQYDIGLQKGKRNVGLVTGLGLTFNDYRFSNGYTLKNVDGIIHSVELEQSGLSKSKLSTGYLTLPLLLEFQVPVKGHDKRFYVSGGVIGGIKLGSHTKVKYHGDKDKNHDDFNINEFRYGATARIGYQKINLFGTYYFSTFFKSGRGPEMNPFTIGICLMNW